MYLLVSLLPMEKKAQFRPEAALLLSCRDSVSPVESPATAEYLSSHPLSLCEQLTVMDGSFHPDYGTHRSQWLIRDKARSC